MVNFRVPEEEENTESSTSLEDKLVPEEEDEIESSTDLDDQTSAETFSVDPYAATFEDDYYPAKILAFLHVYYSKDKQEDVAVIHCCDHRTEADVDKDTRLLQQWTMEYRDPEKRHAALARTVLQIDGRPNEELHGVSTHFREPKLRAVTVDSFGERVIAIEESPGVKEHLNCLLKSSETILSRKLLLVKDRNKYWAGQFLRWDSSKTRTYIAPSKKRAMRNQQPSDAEPTTKRRR
jgi:hypothetical protein